MQRKSIWVGGLALIGLIAALCFSQMHGLGAAAMSPDGQSLTTLSPHAPVLLAQGGEPETLAPTGVQISGDYQDPGGRFQVGILEGFSVNSVSESPLFEAGDGSLAYSIVVLPAGGDVGTDAPLTDAALAQAVKNTFTRGEGFQTTGFEVIDGGGVQIAWVGRLTNGGMTQPMQGKVVARQSGSDIYLLAIAATEAGIPQVDPALTTLAESLQVL